ncbi:MAG: hypothetical protein ISS31_06495 [Kiritimatiellae bacterium]|nr:hypothetical protein [Kiritimatiellia bacterium]
MMHVTWEIDLDAGSPREAAERALEIMQRPDSTATVFTVDDRGEQHTIDLMEEGAADGQTCLD